jgi:hypothetical protein
MLPIFIAKFRSPKTSQPETCKNSHSIYGLFLFVLKDNTLINLRTVAL